MRLVKAILTCILIVALCVISSGCGPTRVKNLYDYRKQGFTRDNVAKIRNGMTNNEVLGLFGEPDHSKGAICGSSTTASWQCIVYVYENGLEGREKKSNEFSFAINQPLLLKSWEIGFSY